MTDNDRAMIDKHLANLRAHDDIDPAEEAFIRDAVCEIRDIPARHVVVRSNEELTTSTLLLSGLMARQKDLANAQRQITQIHIPGDFVDLHSFTLKRLDHDVATLTPCRIAVVPHRKLEEMTERFPHLTRVYWFMTNLDAAIHREWVLSLGRRSALSRLAHLLCELHVRLDLVGMTQNDDYELRLTQTEIAECLGLTNVHVNRTLRELRAQGLVTMTAGRVRIDDVEGLRRAGEFDPGYLYLEHRRR